MFQSNDSFDVALVKIQMTGGLNRPYVSFVHLIKMASVTHQGEVFTSDVKINLPSCVPNTNKYPPRLKSGRIYDEIFVISQRSGNFLFHKMMENMPRLATFIHFLRRYPNIRIHTMSQNAHTASLFRALRLDPKRIVTGTVHGKLVYLPQSTVCLYPLVNEGKLLAQEYLTYITKNLTGDKTWNSVILIKRTIRRPFNQQLQIENIVRDLSMAFGYRYELFSDDPPQSVEETMLTFYRARVIVAPHGAGLANMLFCRPGTRIIEVACSDRPMCFLTSAYQLSHRYFGIPAEGDGCVQNGINVNVSLIASALERFLTEIKFENTY